MDSIRAKQILQSKEQIQVLYQDTPVWLESVNDNNTADVTRLGNHTRDKINVPVYMLVENSPVK